MSRKWRRTGRKYRIKKHRKSSSSRQRTMNEEAKNNEENAEKCWVVA